MLSPGDIIHFKDFLFDNGTVRNKLFIVLCGSPCLKLITTSGSLRYPMVDPGCNPEKRTYFLEVGAHPVFPKPTYIVLPQVWETPEGQLKSFLSGRVITKRQPLSSAQFQGIKNCLNYFRDDISDEHWEAIYSRNAPCQSSLAALQEKFNKRK